LPPTPPPSPYTTLFRSHSPAIPTLPPFCTQAGRAHLEPTRAEIVVIQLSIQPGCRHATKSKPADCCVLTAIFSSSRVLLRATLPCHMLRLICRKVLNSCCLSFLPSL